MFAYIYSTSLCTNHQQEEVDNLARVGLRTLVVAFRHLPTAVSAPRSQLPLPRSAQLLWLLAVAAKLVMVVVVVVVRHCRLLMPLHYVCVCVCVCVCLSVRVYLCARGWQEFEEFHQKYRAAETTIKVSTQHPLLDAYLAFPFTPLQPFPFHHRKCTEAAGSLHEASGNSVR